MKRQRTLGIERLELRHLLASDTSAGIGLLGQYYDQSDLTQWKLSRVDSVIDFQWNSGAPAPEIDSDTFSVRWTGQVEAAYTESYSIYITADDGVRLWLDGELLVDRWSSGPVANQSAIVDWMAGRRYDIQLEYLETTGTALVKLEWASPSQTRQVIPSARLFPSERGSISREVWTTVSGSTVSSLTSNPNYPNNPNQVTLVNAFESPNDIGNDFGQRLRGQLHVPETGNYTFYVAANESAELWLSDSALRQNRILIAAVNVPTEPRDWNRTPQQQSVTLKLVSGQSYYIEALHKESTGPDHLAVGWLRPGRVQVDVIAGEFLSPALPIVKIFNEQPVTAESLSPPATMTIVRSGGPLTAAMDVRYTVRGSAISGVDYSALSGIVTIPAGQSSTSVQVLPLADNLIEPSEQVVVELQDGSGYELSSLSQRLATATIQDNRDAPLGGVNLLAGTALSNFVRFGGTFTTVTVPTYGSAIQAAIGTLPANAWDAQLLQPTNASVQQGDILYAEFFVRAISSNGSFSAIFERRSSPFTKSLSRGIQVGDQWQRIQLGFVSEETYAVGAASFGFHLGTQIQTLQFAGFRLTNYGPSSNLVPPSGLFLNNIGGNYGTMQLLPVAGQNFSEAYRLVTMTTPPNNEPWRFQAVVRNQAAVVSGDQLRVKFFARRIAGPNAKIDVAVQRTDNFATLRFQSITLTDQWMQYTIDLTTTAGFAKDGLQVALNLGFAPQTVEVGDFQWTNLTRGVDPRDLPNRAPPSNYSGRSGADAWRQDADNRIAENRQADFTVRVVDAQGLPVDGAVVHIEQARHAFQFGTAISGYSGLLDPNGSELALKYQSMIKRLFNTVVVENNLKWPDFLNNRSLGIQSAQWAADNGLYLRGHNAIWPSRTFMPATIWSQYDQLLASQGATAATSYLRNTVRARIADAASTFVGIAGEWDVVNEPYTNHDVMDILGNDELLEWFRIFRQNDPSGLRTLNDYDIFARNGANLEHRANFDYWLGRLDGANLIEVIGEQSHYSESNLTDITVLGQLIHSYSTSYGLPIAITEFDVNTSDEQLQADYLRDYLTMSFSQPAIKEFLHWGFWTEAHWLPSAALYRSDFSPKPNGQVYEDLVFDQWWTDARGTTRDGSFRSPAFFGEFDISVHWNGRTIHYPRTAHHASSTIEVALPGVRASTTSLTVQEDGPIIPYQLVLTEPPSDLVQVSLSSNGQITMNPSTVTFTTSNWNTPQSIQVTAVHDTLVEGDHFAPIEHLVTSNDIRFDRSLASVVEVRIIDQPPPLQVTQVVIGDGSLQRSRVESLKVVWNGLIVADDGAITVERRLVGGGSVAVPTFVDIHTVGSHSEAIVRFLPSDSTRPGTAILADSDYRMTLDASKIRRSGFSQNLDGDGDGVAGGDFVFGENQADQFFAYYGDLNADRLVSVSEFNDFRTAFGKSSNQLGFDPRFDYLADGQIGTSDFNQLRSRFGRRL